MKKVTHPIFEKGYLKQVNSRISEKENHTPNKKLLVLFHEALPLLLSTTTNNTINGRVYNF